MKTENEYADMLIEQYRARMGSRGYQNFKSVCVQYAINDVNNTMNAIENIESKWLIREYLISDLTPIELNEDILVKCGAIRLPTKSGFAASYKLGSITINRSSFGNYYYKKNIYNTLHQIQNLYHALEQEELNIIL